MPNYSTFVIAPQGWRRIGLSFLAMFLFALLDLDFLAFLSFLFLAVLLWIYRNPERTIPHFKDKSLVSICDGTITKIEDNDTHYIMSIESGFNDVSLLRMPCDAKIVQQQHIHGAHLPSETLLSEKINERLDMELECQNGEIVKLHQLMRQSFTEIGSFTIAGQSLKQGERFAYLHQGRVQITVPKNIQFSVSEGSPVYAGQTLLGYFL